MKMNLLEFAAMNNPLRRLIQDRVEVKEFLDVPNYVKDGRVVEIGCGSGYGSKLIDHYFHPREIYGIDIDEKMIEIAKKNQSSHITFAVGDVTSLPFEDGSIDGVFDFAILHHVPNWQKAINEIYRILKKRGQIFIEDASLETFSTPLGKLMKIFTDHPYESMYQLDELFSYFEKIGFQIIKKRVYKPLGLTSRFVLVGIKNQS